MTGNNATTKGSTTMSESEFVFYLVIFMLIMVGLVIYGDRQRMKAEALQRELEHSEAEREFLSRLLHPARNRRIE
jgi:Ni,Fe-hydrogenase I cytochrome b subunit